MLTFVQELMCVEVANRLTAAQVLQHPWITEEKGDEAANLPLPHVTRNLKGFNHARRMTRRSIMQGGFRLLPQEEVEKEMNGW